MQINSIHVTKYRCFEEVRLDELGRFVCLVGANGSGKSSMLELVVHFSRTDVSPIAYFVEKEWSGCEGNAELDISIRLSESEIGELYPGQDLSLITPSRLQSLVRFSKDTVAAAAGGVPYNKKLLRTVANKVVFYSPNRSFIIPDTSEERDKPKDDFYRQMTTPSFQDRAQYLVSQMTTLLRRQQSALAAMVKKRAAEGLPYDPKDYSELSEVESVFKRFFTLTGKHFVSPRIQENGRPLFLFRVPWSKTPLPISKLSSGEQWILLFLVELELYKWNDHVILIDEIETHLHPRLAAQLVKVLWEREDNNQYWFTTHSPEVALQVARLRTKTEGRPTVIGFVLDPKSFYAKTVSSDSLELLRSLAGPSAMIPVAATIVLLEGSTVERQLYSVDETLFVELQRCGSIPEGLGFHSVGHSASVEGYEEKLAEVAGKLGVGWQLYAIRDRDALPDDMRIDMMKRSGGRLWVWERSSLEGYLADPKVMASYLASQNVNPAPSEDEIRVYLMNLLSSFKDDTVKRYENQLVYRVFPHRGNATADWLQKAPGMCKDVDNRLSSFRKEVDEWLKKSDWESLLRFADCKKVLQKLVGRYTGKSSTEPFQLAEVVKRIVRDVIASRESKVTPEEMVRKLWPEVSEVVSKMKQGLIFDNAWSSHQ